jgi:hypothetical protein
MFIRFVAVVVVVVLAACQTSQPVSVQPSFSTSPALSVRNPGDIAVLPVEDGTVGGAATRHLTFLREVLQRHLPDRFYSPLTAQIVDAAVGSEVRGQGETILTPAYLRRVAGKSSEDALLAVRVDRWDESTLLADKRLRFQVQAALVANDGEVLWSGTLIGEAKAGGMGAAPRERDAMARSAGELAMIELLNHLAQRMP